MAKIKKEPIPNVETPISRRSFFHKLWIGLGAIAGIEILGVSINFLLHSSKEKRDKDFVVAGEVEEFESNSITPFRAGKFYLVRLSDGGFLAMSLTCTHLGCSVSWDESEDSFVCPCHSSIYKLTGDVVSPPAPRALDLMPVFIEKGIVKVDTSTKIKRQRFDKSQVTYVEA